MSDNGAVISITVPERYAERFRVEAEHNLGTSAQRIYESWKWNTQDRQRDDEPKHPITEREIRRFEDAAHVFRQTREQRGELNIEGSVRVLQSCVHGVLLDVTQDLQAQAELADPDFAPVMEEFEFWRGVRARLDAAAGGWFDVDRELERQEREAERLPEDSEVAVELLLLAEDLDVAAETPEG